MFFVHVEEYFHFMPLICIRSVYFLSVVNYNASELVTLIAQAGVRAITFIMDDVEHFLSKLVYNEKILAVP